MERAGAEFLSGKVLVWSRFKLSTGNEMKHALKNSIAENMHGLLEHMFVNFANQLRAKYPDKTIRNAAVLVSGVPEFARLGYIQLVDGRKGIPQDLPQLLITTIKRSRHHPIWIPGPNFPDKPWDIYEQMQPYLLGTHVLWLHTPSQKPITWRQPDWAD
jgi:hypothetical protein